LALDGWMDGWMTGFEVGGQAGRLIYRRRVRGTGGRGETVTWGQSGHSNCLSGSVLGNPGKAKIKLELFGKVVFVAVGVC
jgi:hypothetical protein